MEKKLYKSATDKMICGVCGGLAEYFNMDPTVVRIICAVICAVTGWGLIAYIVYACVAPEGSNKDIF